MLGMGINIPHRGMYKESRWPNKTTTSWWRGERKMKVNNVTEATEYMVFEK
jgi:hypothetical protein